MTKTAGLAPEEQDFIISSLSPSLAQKRLALGVMLVLLVAFFIITWPLRGVQLARIDPFVPMYATAMFVNDSITALLLFAQVACFAQGCRAQLGSTSCGTPVSPRS